MANWVTASSTRTQNSRSVGETRWNKVWTISFKKSHLTTSVEEMMTSADLTARVNTVSESYHPLSQPSLACEVKTLSVFSFVLVTTLSASWPLSSLSGTLIVMSTSFPIPCTSWQSMSASCPT
jgi:hypothetical protein